MIDYFALALGHGLLAIAMMRLVMRADLDTDPLIDSIQSQTIDNRQAVSVAGRNAARRARSAGREKGAPHSPGDPAGEP